MVLLKHVFSLDFQGSLNHPKGNHAKQAAFYMTFLLVNFAVKNATVFFPFLLSRTGLTISVSLLPVSDAVQCNRSCSALHPSLQCTASSTHMQPFPHVLATAPASTCGKRRHYLGISSPSTTISSPLSSGILPRRQQRAARGYHMSCGRVPERVDVCSFPFGRIHLE